MVIEGLMKDCFMSEQSNQWFILIEGHHRGPYLPSLIRQWKKEGKLSHSTLVWREGEPSWLRLEQVEELRLLSPGKVLERELKATPRKIQKEFLQEKTPIEPHHLPPLPETVKVSLYQNIYKGVCFMGSPRFLAPTTIIWILIITGYSLYGPSGQALMKAIRVGQQDLFQLSKDVDTTFKQIQLKSELTPQIISKGRLIWGMKGESLHLLTHKKINAPVRLVFESIPNRILSNQEISFYVEGVIAKGVATFKEFHFLRGFYLARGYYRVFLQSDLVTLSGEKGSFPSEFFYGDNETLFAEQLNRFRQMANREELKHHDELLERYTTLTSLVSYIEKIFEESLTSMNQGKDIQVFKERYSREIAMVMHGVALDHSEDRLSLKDSNSFLLKEYNNLTRIGRLIGEDVVNLVNKVELLSFIDELKKGELRHEFHSQLESVRKSIQSSIDTISREI